MTQQRRILESNNEVLRSLQQAMSHIPPHLQETVAVKFVALFELFREGHDWRVPMQFNVEGDLDGRRRFYALKVRQLRCYGWFHKGDFVISHYVFKTQQKLSKFDTARVRSHYQKWQSRLGANDEFI